MTTIEDFKKLDIRIGKVVSVEKVPDADKLLKIMFDVGETEQRQILAGIAEFFPDPLVLVGKEMPVLLNIEPRTLRGLVSQGMVMAVGTDAEAVLLHPAKEVTPGSVIR